MNCNHQYICVQAAGVNYPYAIAACPHCGHTRHVYPDGKIIIVNQESKITDRTQIGRSNEA